MIIIIRLSADIRLKIMEQKDDKVTIRDMQGFHFKQNDNIKIQSLTSGSKLHVKMSLEKVPQPIQVFTLHSMEKTL